MSISQQVEKWSEGAKAYEDVVPKLTSQGGIALLKLVKDLRPLDNNANVLDTGAGTGALTTLLRQQNAHMSLTAADPAPGMLTQLRQRAIPNITVLQVDANKDLIAQGLSPNTFTHVLSTFVLQFVSPVQHAIDQIFNILEPGGIIGSAIWAKTDVGLPWTIACRKIDPTYEPNDAAFFSEPLKSCEDLETYYSRAGFVDCRASETQCWMEFESAEAFAEYFMYSGNPPFLTVMSSWKGKIEDVKDELIKVTREQFDNGRISFVAACSVARKP